MPIEASTVKPEKTNQNQSDLPNPERGAESLPSSENGQLEFAPLTGEDNRIVLAQANPVGVKESGIAQTDEQAQLNLDKIPEVQIDDKGKKVEGDAAPVDGKEADLEITKLDFNKPPSLLLTRLAAIARGSVGKSELGNRAPEEGNKYGLGDIPRKFQCASTMSDLLLTVDMMEKKDFQVRVTDFNDWAEAKFGKGIKLPGKFDLKDYPEGPIGFLSGTGDHSDGGNHVGFVEREGDTVYITHNKMGTVRREDVRDVMYKNGGKEKFSNLQLFRIR